MSRCIAHIGMLIPYALLRKGSSVVPTATKESTKERWADEA